MIHARLGQWSRRTLLEGNLVSFPASQCAAGVGLWHVLPCVGLWPSCSPGAGIWLQPGSTRRPQRPGVVARCSFTDCGILLIWI